MLLPGRRKSVPITTRGSVGGRVLGCISVADDGVQRGGRIKRTRAEGVEFIVRVESNFLSQHRKEGDCTVMVIPGCISFVSVGDRKMASKY